MTKQQLKDELKQSMLAQSADKTSVLRMLLSAINYYEINKGGAGYEATEEDVMAVIQKEAKQRNDSIEQFKAAGRNELAEKEEKELEMLKKYLPQQMPEEEIRTIVSTTIHEIGAKSTSDMGKVMSALMGKVKGKADGTLVSRLVKEALSKE